VRGNGRHGCPPRGEGEDVAPGGRRGLHERANMMVDLFSISTETRLTGQPRAGVSGQHQAPGPAVLASVTIACMCSVAISLLLSCPVQSDLTFVFQRSSTTERHHAKQRILSSSNLMAPRGIPPRADRPRIARGLRTVSHIQTTAAGPDMASQGARDWQLDFPTRESTGFSSRVSGCRIGRVKSALHLIFKS
jgi:hypothetical protein